MKCVPIPKPNNETREDGESYAETRATRGESVTVEVTVDGDHAVPADPALDGDRGAIGDRRWCLKRLLSKGFNHDLPGGGMSTGIDDLGQPGTELGVQIIEVPKAAG